MDVFFFVFNWKPNLIRRCTCNEFVMMMIDDWAGVWLMHCHFDVHLSWGLRMAWIVQDGKLPNQKLPPPPSDLPKCWSLTEYNTTASSSSPSNLFWSCFAILYHSKSSQRPHWNWAKFLCVCLSWDFSRVLHWKNGKKKGWRRFCTIQDFDAYVGA